MCNYNIAVNCELTTQCSAEAWLTDNGSTPTEEYGMTN